MIKKNLLILSGILLIFIAGGVLIFTNHLKISGNALKIDAKNTSATQYSYNKKISGASEIEKLNQKKEYYQTQVFADCTSRCPDQCKIENPLNLSYSDCMDSCLSFCEGERLYLTSEAEKEIKQLNKGGDME